MDRRECAELIWRAAMTDYKEEALKAIEECLDKFLAAEIARQSTPQKKIPAKASA